MKRLEIEATLADIVEKLATGGDRKEILAQILDLHRNAPAEHVTILLAGQVITALRLLSNVEGRPLAETVARWSRAVNLARMDEGLEGGD